jgi:hypothetical protein
MADGRKVCLDTVICYMEQGAGSTLGTKGPMWANPVKEG